MKACSSGEVMRDREAGGTPWGWCGVGMRGQREGWGWLWWLLWGGYGGGVFQGRLALGSARRRPAFGCEALRRKRKTNINMPSGLTGPYIHLGPAPRLFFSLERCG